MGNSHHRLDRALAFCTREKEQVEFSRHSYFAGSVSEDEYGAMRIEGHLFHSRKEAQAEIMGRLKRAHRYMTLVSGEFAGEVAFSNRQRWKGFPVEITRYAGSKKKGAR